MANAVPPQVDHAARSRGPWSMVLVLAFCYLVSSLDRFVIGLLIQPIATSLKLSDLQISLLIGIAFTVFYGTAGIALGGLVDRFNRRLIIVAGILIWTIATAATGLAWNYTSLLATRILVGTGEAALAPSAYSLIAEAFPRHKLSRPTTVYFLGGAIGPGVSLVLGGLALHWADQLNDHHMLGALQDEPWRFVLLLASLPGLVAALVAALFVRDSRRASQADVVVARVGSLWSELASKPLIYLGLLCGTCGVSIYINGLVAWWPTHALRTLGWPLKDSGVYFGVALAISAVVGIFTSGTIGTVLMRRFGDAGNAMALITLAVIGAPLFVCAPLVPAVAWQLGLVTLALGFAFAINGLAPVGCQLAAGSNMRGRVSAVYVASTSIVGAGLGPVAVAALEGMKFGHGSIGLKGGLILIGLFASLLMIASYSLYFVGMRRWASRDGVPASTKI